MLQSTQPAESSTYLSNAPAYRVACPKCKAAFYSAQVNEPIKKTCVCGKVFIYLITKPRPYVTVEVV